MHAGEKPFSCCGKCFVLQRDLDTHVKVHTVALLLRMWQRLQKVHSGDVTFSCSYCRKSFPESSLLAEHQQTHLANKDLTCTVCGQCFGFHSRLSKHLPSHSGQQPFSCSECGKGFWFSSELNAHLRTHPRLSFFFSQQ
ncbi:gastrula zinc finger protein XlCGF17.1-like [Xenopus tropicalis]|uniref:Gastrula zinc finger protein XlCGF17.1-like n=1 Tax=Xenopus tropicalis TaxID=8364 RepID=A0A8J1JNR6_XENTR|nr:gastrula zinc finger protein XlCGF17.1-like [Xenopus tropicalis]